MILLLDQLEDVIDTSTSDFAITDAALDHALRTLLDAPAHGVKVIVTTRVAPRALLLAHPERQMSLSLDEGLGSPYAEEVLRARDPDGRLGLKTARDELLDQARQRTRGYPRALEALAAILAADRNTTLPELLDQTARLPGNVVEVLVGEAFNRLDPLAQQVMQTLAIFTVPVPPVAVDYLLQPYRPAVDAAPVLARLVNMQFVRRDLGRYYLHQVDRDYALSRVPAGDPSDRQADPVPFTQQALRHRGADYFALTRTPREDWQTLDDLAPQLNEYELRCQGEEYGTAAQVLLAIDSAYLILWGHYRLTVQMHERLQGHLDDPWTNAASKERLGTCYQVLGQIPAAIDLYQQAGAIAREIGDRRDEGVALGHRGSCYFQLGHFSQALDLFQQALTIARQTGNRRGEASMLNYLGVCHWSLGRVRQAIDLCQQALTIARQIGNRASEAGCLTSLGLCHRNLGQLTRTIDFYEQALTIARQTGNRASEATNLTNLGITYRDLGQLTRAIDLHEQALSISREIGSRSTESNVLDNLANACGDLEAWNQAVQYSQQAVEIGDEISVAQVQGVARLSLARIQLLTGDLQAAQQAALAARDHPYPHARAQVSLIVGITQLRQHQAAAAALEFRDAAAQADELLQQDGDAYAQLDMRALALCGLALTTSPDKAEAIATFRAARAITSADGIVKQVLALFDAVAVADNGRILAGIRPSAEGKG